MYVQVTVIAPTKEALSAAARAIQELLASAHASSRLGYNYFVSLPLADEGVRSKFQALQNQVGTAILHVSGHLLNGDDSGSLTLLAGANGLCMV